MALIGKADATSDVGKRPARGDELTRGKVHANAPRVFADRASKLRAKYAIEMSRMDVSHTGNIGKSKFVRRVCVQIVNHCAEPLR